MLHSKFVPPGPEYFCANPGVTHVGDRTNVYKCPTFGAMVGTSCKPVLPIPMTATRLPSSLIDLSYTAVCASTPLKSWRPSIFGHLQLLNQFSGMKAESRSERNLLEEALVIDQDFCRVCKFISIQQILYFHIPNTCFLLPYSFHNLMVYEKIFAKVVGIEDLLHVLLDLFPGRVELFPIGVLGPRELVCVIGLFSDASFGASLPDNYGTEHRI